jgi:hypothetical protein
VDKLKTKWFDRWARKNKISNEMLSSTIISLENDQSTVDLGSNLYKVRVARKGSGKSSGYRTILVYKKNKRAIFVYGFAKNERENISSLELKAFKTIGNDLLNLTVNEISVAVENKALHKIEEKL